ncbi:MAG: hypothetical protein HY683_08660 [Chloroflexi bacterium]|nr:hypothetical protein [Chloroflexota bacterium]
MNNDPYAEKLASFKQNEKPEVVLLVADNPELIKVVVAWTNVEVRRPEKLTSLRGGSEAEVWKWLWENTRYSRGSLIESLGISYSEAGLETKLKPLIGNRIIYPDGTINSFVQRFLRDRVLKLFDSKLKKTSKKV